MGVGVERRFDWILNLGRVTQEGISRKLLFKECRKLSELIFLSNLGSRTLGKWHDIFSGALHGKIVQIVKVGLPEPLRLVSTTWAERFLIVRNCLFFQEKVLFVEVELFLHESLDVNFLEGGDQAVSEIDSILRGTSHRADSKSRFADLAVGLASASTVNVKVLQISLLNLRTRKLGLVEALAVFIAIILHCLKVVETLFTLLHALSCMVLGGLVLLETQPVRLYAYENDIVGAVVV